MITSHVLGHVVVALLAAKHPQEQGASLLPERIHINAPSHSIALGEGGQKKTEKTDKCQFWPYIHTYSIKTDIFLFFS